MSKYKSTTVYTSNEAEEYEVELVYKNGFVVIEGSGRNTGMLGKKWAEEIYIWLKLM